MRFIEMREPGGPEVLVLADGLRPEPGDKEVQIRVAAAGVNRPDCLQRQGRYPPPPGASSILGLEVAGVVAACGPGVARWKPGDQVCALLAGGGYAEFAVAPEVQCLPVPRGLDLIPAAALPENVFTVWTNLFEDGGLHAGQRVLIQGGAGGIGTTASQLAHATGAEVFVTVGRRESERLCRDCGADHVLFYREEDFVERIREITSGRGVDVILDIIGGPYLPRNLEALAFRGRLVQIAAMQGARVELDLRQVMSKRAVITGSFLRSRPVEEKGRIADAVIHNVWPLLESGRVVPKGIKTYPLENAAEAHAQMESGNHAGKIVLTVDETSPGS